MEESKYRFSNGNLIHNIASKTAPNSILSLRKAVSRADNVTITVFRTKTQIEWNFPNQIHRAGKCASSEKSFSMILVRRDKEDSEESN